MLSRRQLRIKVLQALYAFFQSKSDRMDFGEKQLFISIEKIYELCFWQLSFMIEIVDFTKVRTEEAKHKHFPTPENLNPNTKFIDNKLIEQIRNNRIYEKKYDQYKISWAEQTEMIRRIYKEIIESKYYEKFMDEPERTYEGDKEFIILLLKKVIAKSESLKQFYEDLSIYWSDDYHSVTALVIKIINSFTEESDTYHLLPVIYKTANEAENEDVDFVKSLYRKTIINSDKLEKLITEKTVNWEYDRIAVMDIIILKMALTELTEFKSVPVKVTLNEYIELSKSYSTPKSNIFVNGILDKLINDLSESKDIRKTGRGLMN
ncbi:MAG: transcription antitermination factor NusB [Bacteroidetes bacterium HGW-Bacteroidetes-17]|nr:MAG: transcription antitermination factor NusB [Bacteroidetes bacterium HGW-Bacteroidetes-17]